MADTPFGEPWRWLGPEDLEYDAILRRLMKEASEVIPGLSPDPMQADPVVVMLLRAFSREYVRLYGLLESSVGLAYSELVTRLLAFPRGPEPATTVLKVQARDAGTRVPREFQALASQPIQLGARQTARAFFAPIQDGTTTAYEVAHRVLVTGDGTAAVLPEEGPAGASWRAARARGVASVYFALEAEGAPGNAPVELFLYGEERALRAALWSPWRVPPADGGPARPVWEASEKFASVPGGRYASAHPAEPAPFTFRSDLRREESPYSLQFVPLPAAALASGEATVPRELGEPGAALPPPRGRRAWLRVDFEEAAPELDPGALRAVTNAFLFGNREARTSRAVQVDEQPVHSWMMPEDVGYENLLGVESVVDLKSGHAYSNAEALEGHDATRTYRIVPSVSGGRVRLVVEMLNHEEQRRRSEVEIKYGLSLGPAANGLAAGSVSQLYSGPQAFPGIQAIRNLVPTLGGRPGRGPDARESELRSVLRHRARLVSRSDYLDAVRAFDPGRVRGARLEPGVVRVQHGLRRSLEVHVDVAQGGFVNSLERDAFRMRLEAFLQDRSVAGEHVRVLLDGEAVLA